MIDKIPENPTLTFSNTRSQIALLSKEEDGEEGGEQNNPQTVKA